jgi:YVTN family beta-propeller protein
MRIRTFARRASQMMLLALGTVCVLGVAPEDALRAKTRRLREPSHSGPVAVSPDDRTVWVVNPDNASVTAIDVGKDRNRVIAHVKVGEEPQNLLISPDGKAVYVSNTVSGTVSVIRADNDHPKVVETIAVGTEPWGMALTPNGRKLYVANARSNDVSVIDTEARKVIETIDGVGLEPRGVAITNDGDEESKDERVLVTQFLGVDVPGVLIGRDDYKEGRVTVISAKTDRVTGQIVLHPLANTGFNSNGSVLNHVPAANPPAFTFPTGAFPNQLNSIVIKGSHAYLPNTGASPDGPVRFNVNVQALLSVIDLGTGAEGTVGGVPQTINMNRGVNFEAAATQLFFAVPWAIAFEHRREVGYAVIAGSNVVVKVDLDADGTPTLHAPAAAADPGAIVRVPVGQNPRGIAINRRDDRAYVMNYVSRDVSVIDLTATPPAVIATVPAADLPAAGTEDARIQIGKAVFNSSTGVNLPQLGPGGVIGKRLSANGWGACSACHPHGLTDGVVWIFASGPRRTLPLNGSFNPRDPQDARILNHSAIFDEIQDFELNIRNVSGGQGLITLADGTTPDPNVLAFNPANGGRNEALDAMTLFVARGIRSPISPLSAHGHDDGVSKGRRLFEKANCASCHGGAGWASSRRDFTPPPAATEIVNTQLIRFLRKVGTFDPAAANELRANGAPALGADGFNPPSLLGDWALGPFLHNGSALTLDDVMENVAHRSAGTAGVDRLAKAEDRRRIVQFLSSIDASTKPFGPGGSRPRAADDDRAVAALEGSPAELALAVKGQNPITTSALIAYSLPKSGRVQLALFDVAGRRVATLVDGTSPAGRFEVPWAGRTDGGGTARAGVYFVRLRTTAEQRVSKLVLSR